MTSSAPLAAVRTTGPILTLVRLYVALVAATLIALAVLAATTPRQAPAAAWGHAVVVAFFAVLLPLRARAAARGSAGALRAVGVIAIVLAVVNVVEAVLPREFPAWMRIEMVLIAVLMAALAVQALKRR